MSIVAIGILVAFLTVVFLNIGGYFDYLISTWLYSIAKSLMWLCDFVQVLFRRLAGLDTTYYKDSNGVVQAQEDDILFSLLTSRTVQQTFLAMVLVGVCIIIIASVVQMIRVEYTTEGSKNNKATILGSALKGFSYFFIVPIAVTLGIMVSNYILKAVDNATGGAGSSTIAGSVFLSAASNANRVRNNDTEGYVTGLIAAIDNDGIVKFDATNGKFTGTHAEKENNVFGVTNISEARNRENAAAKIDNLFASGSSISLAGSSYHIEGLGDVSYGDVSMVKRYYNISDIDILILYVGLCICIVALFKAAFGMIMRIYQTIVLFIISPGIIGLWPLDNGKAFGSWRSKFIASVLSAYGVIVALNLYFVVAGALRNVYIFPDQFGYYTLNLTCQALFTIVGALMITNLSSTISSLIGADDGLKQGGDMAGKVVSGIGKGVGAVTMVATGGAALAGKLKGGINTIMDKKGWGKGGKDDHDFVNKQSNKDAYTQKKGQLTTLLQKQKDAAAGKGPALTKEETDQIASLQNDSAITEYETAQRNIQRRSVSRAKHTVNQARLTGIASSFFKNTGMGKSMNTMTAGLLPIFGGKVQGEVDKSIVNDPAVADDMQTRKEWMKNNPGSISTRLEALGGGHIADAILTGGKTSYSKRRADAAEGRARDIQNIKELSDKINFASDVQNTLARELTQTRDELKTAIQELVTALQTRDATKVKGAQAIFNNSLIKAENMGLDVSQFRKAGNYSAYTKRAEELGKLDTANLQFKEGTVYGDAVKTDGKLDDKSLGALEAAARKLQEAGQAIQTMSEKANAERQTYAEKEGKPEVAINALASSLKSNNAEVKNQNNEIVRLLQQMVNKIQ